MCYTHQHTYYKNLGSEMVSVCLELMGGGWKVAKQTPCTWPFIHGGISELQGRVEHEWHGPPDLDQGNSGRGGEDTEATSEPEGSAGDHHGEHRRHSY